MKFINVRFLFFLILVTIIGRPLSAQQCRDNFNKAEECRRKGDYTKAIEYYTKSRDCGDASYKRKSVNMIRSLENKINELNAVKNALHSKKSDYLLVEDLLYLPHDIEEGVVKVESSGRWDAKVILNSNNIQVSKKNSKTLLVSSVSKNTSTHARTSIINVECGEITRTITVEQGGVPEVLEIKGMYLNIPYKGGRFVMDVNTNTRWKVESSDWYKATPLNNDSTHLMITVDSNPRNEARHGTIILRSESELTYDEVEIHQTANESRIFAPVDSIIQIKAQGDTIHVPVISDNSSWNPSDHPSWCHSAKVNDSTLLVTIVPNENYVSRQGFVNLKSGDRVTGIWILQDASELPDLLSKKVLGGRNVSFGITAGYVMPFVKSTSSGTYTGSVINYSLGNSGEDVNYSSAKGFSFGAVLDLRVYRNWFIKTGIDYTHLQYTNTFNAEAFRTVPQGFNVVYQGTFQNKFKEKYKFNILSIPLLASYRFVFDKRNNLQVDLGPVLNVAVSGKMSFEGNSNSDNVYPHSVIYDEAGPVIGNRSSEYMRYTGEMDLFDTKVTNTTTSSVGGMHRDFLNEFTAIAAPYNRVSLGLRFGVTYEYSGLQIGIAYTHMLTNMANNSFWDSGRLPIFGQTSNVLMAGYKHRIHELEFKVGYVLRYRK